MYLSLSLCAFQERGHSQREKALSWERKQFLYPLARVYLKRPHTQRHLERLSLSHSLSLRKSSSFSSSFREREKETYFFRLLVALSEPISFPYIFFHVKKVVSRAHAALSLSLAHAQRAASREDETMVYYCSTFCAFIGVIRENKERKRAQRAPVVLIFV